MSSPLYTELTMRDKTCISKQHGSSKREMMHMALKLTILLIIIWEAFYLGIAESALSQDLRLLLKGLENQIKHSLNQYGFTQKQLDEFSLAGTIELGILKALPKTEGLVRKYSCTINSNIQMLEKDTGKTLERVVGSYADIGRNPTTAIEYALGKVVRRLFAALKKILSEERGCGMEKTFAFNATFKNLEDKEEILKMSIDELSQRLDKFLTKDHDLSY